VLTEAEEAAIVAFRDVWHLDEVAVKITGRSFWLWRAVDQNGVVL
jgi:transposase-like protein